jgi:hypothetical protein
LKDGEYFYKVSKTGIDTVYGGFIVDGAVKSIAVEDFE